MALGLNRLKTFHANGCNTSLLGEAVADIVGFANNPKCRDFFIVSDAVTGRLSHSGTLLFDVEKLLLELAKSKELPRCWILDGLKQLGVAGNDHQEGGGGSASAGFSRAGWHDHRMAILQLRFHMRL